MTKDQSYNDKGQQFASPLKEEIASDMVLDKLFIGYFKIWHFCFLVHVFVENLLCIDRARFSAVIVFNCLNFNLIHHWFLTFLAK